MTLTAFFVEAEHDRDKWWACTCTGRAPITPQTHDVSCLSLSPVTFPGGTKGQWLCSGCTHIFARALLWTGVMEEDMPQCMDRNSVRKHLGKCQNRH